MDHNWPEHITKIGQPKSEQKLDKKNKQKFQENKYKNKNKLTMVKSLKETAAETVEHRGKEDLWRGEKELSRHRRCRAARSFRGPRQRRGRGGSPKADGVEER